MFSGWNKDTNLRNGKLAAVALYEKKWRNKTIIYFDTTGHVLMMVNDHQL